MFGLASRFTAGIQYFETQQNDVQFVNILGRRTQTKLHSQINQALNLGAYAEEQLDVLPALTAVAGARAQYSRRDIRDKFLADGNQSGDIDYFAFVPRFGVIGRVSKDVQVYTNASYAYEPPLVLELTAPGNLLTRNLDLLKAQKAWQFEIGTRGRAFDRVAWDVAVYDIELWDEIQNVNVLPFPGAFFTLPRFRNIQRSRHMGVEAGADVVLARDLLPRFAGATTGDALTARAAYTWSRFVFVNDVNFANNDIPGAPRHFLRAELRYDHGSGFWIAPNVELVPQGYFVNSQNANRTSPYELGGLRMGYDVKPWNLSLFFEARNLANVAYASSVQVDNAAGRFIEPGDGRAFYGGVAWRWK